MTATSALAAAYAARRTWDGGYSADPCGVPVPDEEGASVVWAPSALPGEEAWICGRCELEQRLCTPRLFTPLFAEAAVCPHCAEVLLALIRHRHC